MNSYLDRQSFLQQYCIQNIVNETFPEETINFANYLYKLIDNSGPSTIEDWSKFNQ